MASLRPVVLEHIDIPTFIQYLLDQHTAPSTLVACSTKETFLKCLQEATVEKAPHECTKQNHDQNSLAEENHRLPRRVSRELKEQAWTTPTLRLLSSSRTITVVFCPEFTDLRAYLATYNGQPNGSEQRQLTLSNAEVRLLAILNPLDVHRATSAFSAQGLNRTFAIAVEAAHHTNSRLLLAECPGGVGKTPFDSQPPCGEDQIPRLEVAANPWDEEVSLLNVTTKSFGAGERGWVGRTVALRAVAQRWCTFEDLRTTDD